MNDGEPDMTSQQLLAALQNPQTWTPCSQGGSSAVAVQADDTGSELATADTHKLQTIETHISWVFLTADCAYKVKKPIETGFLDFGSLEARHHFCEEELRLNRRYAPDLYQAVVPIRLTNGQLTATSETGRIVEYAVQMQRFPDDSLLTDRLQRDHVTVDHIVQLAAHVAEFHDRASIATADQRFGAPDQVLQDALDNFQDLRSVSSADASHTLKSLEEWTRNFFDSHRAAFQQRRDNGRIRECHGDLHAGNVVHWHGQLVPFDGIEFSETLRWIDVLNDVAFLFMDLFAQQRSDLAASFLNAWLERSGDYEALPLLRFYAVYRALVRAKVALIQAGQAQDKQHQATHKADCLQHIQLADQLAHDRHPSLWITHGLSGSGKTTVSNIIIQNRAAMRVRSDVERKRMHAVPVHQQASVDIYNSAATDATYDRLRLLSDSILNAGYAVVVDATFLERAQRQRFHQLAQQHDVPFAIAHCEADVSSLEKRLRDREKNQQDASDAGVDVLHQQLKTQDELTADEWQLVADLPIGPTQSADSASQAGC